MTSFRWNAVCIDCRPEDLDAVTAFYAALLGLEVVDEDQRWKALRSPAGGMGINVQAEDSYLAPVWPDAPPAPAKMLHLEIEVDDVPAAVERATSLGATEAAWQPPDRDPSLLRVLLDPAGHPLCLWS